MVREELNSSAFWYYNLGSAIEISVRYMVEMDNVVDYESLSRALTLTMSRYPYLRKRIIVEPEGYYLTYNDLPVPIIHTDEPLKLCGAESNYHQFALSYWGNKIYINNNHAIFDGRGRGAFLHTLMYYYCKFRYREDVDMPGVILAGTSVDPAEYADPYVMDVPKSEDFKPVSIKSARIPDNVMRLSDMGLVIPSNHPQIHRIRIPEKQLMALCKKEDATPNTAISLIMSRAIAKLHPDTKKEIVPSILLDWRKYLNVPLTHLSMVSSIRLDYSRDMWNLDFAEQNTIFRGKMIIETENRPVLENYEAMRPKLVELNGLPTLEEKRHRAFEMYLKWFKPCTFYISYSGKNGYGSCEKHIKSLCPEAGGLGHGILFEVAVVNGWFDITYIQDWKEDVYFNAFLKEAINLGLDFDLLYSAEAKLVKAVVE